MPEIPRPDDVPPPDSPEEVVICESRTAEGALKWRQFSGKDANWWV